MKKKVKRLALAKETVLGLENFAKAQGGSLSGAPCQSWQATCACGGGSNYNSCDLYCLEEPISNNTQC